MAAKIVQQAYTDARSGTKSKGSRAGLVVSVKNRGTTARSGTGKR